RIVEPPQRGEKRVVVKKATNLERLLLTYHAPEIDHPDSYPLQVAAVLLGRGKTSRFYQRLVERDQSVVFANASFDEAIDPTLFTVAAELKPGYQLADVERALVEEIGNLASEEVPAAELEKAKNLIEAQFILQNESSLSQAILLGIAEVLLSHTYLDSYMEKIRTVTPADVQRVAQAYLAAENRTVGWLVPEAETRAEKGQKPPAQISAWLEQAARGRWGRLDNAAALEAGIVEARAARLEAAQGEKQAKRQRKPARPAAPVRFEIRPGLPGERRVLPNGLTVLVVENPNLPAVSLAAVVKAGSRYESDEKAGLAVLASRLLTEGTTSRSALDIATAIESVGSSLNATADYESCVVTATVLKKDFDLALELVGDVLRNPVFPEERVARERARLMAQIRSAQDQPRTVASWTFNELVFAGHPQHRPSLGYGETVERLTRDDLASLHEQYFAPNNTLVAIVGDISLAEAFAKVEAALGGWAAKRIEPLRLPELRRQEKRVTKYVPMDKEQVNVYIGHVGIDRSNPDYYALEVMDTILGGGPGFTSRIPGHLRDEQGLAYSTFSNITGSAGLDPGRFIAYIGASPENLEKAIAGILKEIQTIVAEPVTETELADAQAYLTGSFVFEFDTNADIARFLVDAETYKLGFDYIDRYPGEIRAVTVADIRRVSRRYLDPENYTLVVVGPVDEQGKPVAKAPPGATP
ncbi:MAG: insulinase family protein, partial [Acidobacteria bacterium]|nr:insulinase family protein [Acidobacteriota bacterium]